MTAAIFILAQAATDASPGTVGGSDGRALLLGLLTGIAFGALLERTGASSYAMIVNMLRLKDLTIMKFLFAAVAAGSVGIYLVDRLGTAHIGIAPVYLVGIPAGGVIFGIGWALAGYCPGTALVAMAQGKADAAVTVLGGLAGALTMSLMWDRIKPALIDPLNYGSRSVPDLLGADPLLTALVFAALLAVLIAWLDRQGRRGKPLPGKQRPKTGTRPGLIKT